MRDYWDAKADDLESEQPRLGRFPIPGLIRKVRRVADLSQRELAARAGLSQSTVVRAEAGSRVPSLDILQRLLACAGYELIVIDRNGRVVQPMRESEWTRDLGGRRYPSHLDVLLNPRYGDWWFDGYGLARGPGSYFRDRRYRDGERDRERRAMIRWPGIRRRGSGPELGPDEYDDLD
jgi:transcriptional regulator with XRE-family HTH domain